MSVSTIAPGRTPGQVPVPTGGATGGTAIRVQHGTPPSVQLAALAPAVAPLAGAALLLLGLLPGPQPSSTMTAASIATTVLVANIFVPPRIGWDEAGPRSKRGRFQERCTLKMTFFSGSCRSSGTAGPGF